MNRFSPSFLDNITNFVFIATIVFFLFIAYRHFKSYQRGRADTFLRYRTSGIGAPPLTAGLLRATLMASSFSLASAIYVYINWGASDGALAFWSPLTWALGAFALYLLRKRIFNESRDVWTMHAFLKKKFSSNTLMKCASIVTSTVFLLQVAAEVYVGLAVLQVFFGFKVHLFLLCIIIGAVFISYTILGGLPSVLITDKYQYRLVGFALILVTIILFNEGGATAVNNIAISFKESFLPSGSSLIIVLSLFSLNLPLLITDMSVWQRIGAVSDVKEVTKGLGSFAASLLGWMCLVVAIGVGFAPFFKSAPGLSSAQGMLSYFSDSLVFPVLIAAFLAALLSTGDTFLISSVQTILVDWKYHKSLLEVNYDPEKLRQETHKKMLRDSRLGILLVGFGSVILGYIFFSYLPSLLDLLFVIFGLQISLTVPIVWSLFKEVKSSEALAAVSCVISGAIISVICLILALGDYSILGVNISLWSPVLVLSCSALIFFILLRFRRAIK